MANDDQFNSQQIKVWGGLKYCCDLSQKADVVLKFVEEEAPAVIQPNTLYVPKPEIQVIFTFKRRKDLLHTAADATRLPFGLAHANRRLRPPSFDSSCLSAAFIQGTGEEAADGGLQHLHRTHPVSVPAPPHPGNAAAWLTEHYSQQSYLKTHFKKTIIIIIMFFN